MHGNRDRNGLVVKIEALTRLGMWRLLSSAIPLVLVTEYPKSGGTWFALMLAEYLDLPFPRNRFPPLRRCVMHGHHTWHRSYSNLFYVLRDGRDVMVSSYFHHVVGNDRVHPSVIRRNRDALGVADPEDARKHLPAYIDYLFTRHDRARTRFTWAEYVRSFEGRSGARVRYEGLLEDPVAEIGNAIREALGIEPDEARIAEIAERHSFRNVARRKPGEENTASFLRKGVAGDWREKFTPEACEVFDRHAGAELILAGYEPDRSWAHANSAPDSPEGR